MSNHQKGGGVTELVGPLVKRLKLAKERVPENSEMEKVIEQMSIEVVKIKDILDSREKLDKELAGCLQKIERQIHPLMDCQPCVKATYDLPQKATITEVGQSSNQNHQMDQGSNLQQLRGSLDEDTKECLDSLAIFPENVVLKKRFLTSLWLARFSHDEVECERIFSNLMDMHVLIPVVYRDHNKVINCFTIEPILHKQLISYCESVRDRNVIFEKREEGSWCLFTRMLLNIDQRYLDSMDIIDTMNKNDVHVVQLGSWRYTTEVHKGVKQIGYEETKSKDHIEVNQIDFLKKLGKDVRYLSMRGISGIVELPVSVGKLEHLRVLDLRACHNLEKIPERPSNVKRLDWFLQLHVLDISQCYLLDHMPEWVGELYNLRVLKGFVVGSLGNKKQSCRLSDLSLLLGLWKLSIRFTIDILGPEVFRGFNFLVNLSVLTITWRQNKEIPTYYLPNNIEKLDIRCYPEAEVLSKLQNPEELTKLKRLYIRGGNLTKIPCHDNWQVEIMRLRFLNKLVYPTDWEELKSSFKKLKYVEYVGCTKPKNFPNNGSSWHNEVRSED